MGASDDFPDLDDLEQLLRQTLARVEQDVEDAVRRIDRFEAETLVDQLDVDLDDLDEACALLRNHLVRSAAAGHSAPLRSAVSDALDEVLSDVVLPLAVTSRVPADLPLPDVQALDLRSLCVRALRLLTRVARAGDALVVTAVADPAPPGGPVSVALALELRPFEAAHLAAQVAELRRSTESLAEFVANSGGTLGFEEDGCLRLCLEFPCRSETC